MIKCLIDRAFKICNDWTSFHNDLNSIKNNLIKNAYPKTLIEKVFKRYIDNKFSDNQSNKPDKPVMSYFKLLYIDKFSDHIKLKILKLSKQYCKDNFNIKIVFDSFKIKNCFS